MNAVKRVKIIIGLILFLKALVWPGQLTETLTWLRMSCYRATRGRQRKNRITVGRVWACAGKWCLSSKVAKTPSPVLLFVSDALERDICKWIYLKTCIQNKGYDLEVVSAWGTVSPDPLWDLCELESSDPESLLSSDVTVSESVPNDFWATGSSSPSVSEPECTSGAGAAASLGVSGEPGLVGWIWKFPSPHFWIEIDGCIHLIRTYLLMRPLTDRIALDDI